MSDNPISSSADIAPASAPAGNKGTGGGTYDGVKGLPGRTSSPNAVPEKLIDATTPAMPKGLE